MNDIARTTFGPLITPTDLAEQVWIAGRRRFVAQQTSNLARRIYYLGSDYELFLSGMTVATRLMYWQDLLAHIPPISAIAALANDPALFDRLEVYLQLRLAEIAPEVPAQATEGLWGVNLRRMISTLIHKLLNPPEV